MRKSVAAIVTAATLAGGASAEAGLLTFNEIQSTESIKSFLTYGGFNFESDHFHTYGVGKAFSTIAWNGTTHIGYEAGRGDPLVMTSASGEIFSLRSLDVSEFYDYRQPRANAQFLQITGVTVSNLTITHSLFLDGVVDGIGGATDFEHFALPDRFTDLLSVTFTGLMLNGSAGGVTLDNIEYQSVPEPGSLALLAVGLFAAVGSRSDWRRLTLSRSSHRYPEGDEP